VNARRLWLRLPTALVLALAACSNSGEATNNSNNSAPQISVFSAAPSSIEAGDSSTLFFASPTDGVQLSIDNGVGSVTGKSEAAVAPAATTTYTLTATHGGKTVTATTTVTVNPRQPTSISVELASATAGMPANATLKALDRTGQVAASFTGQATVTTDDPGATVASPVTFAAGQATSAITFKASGTHVIQATLSAPGSGSGTGTVNVAPGTADHCTVTQVPGNATAGAVLGARVTFFDAQGNVATGFAGTVTLTATDASAQLPPSGTYDPATDAGSRVFAARLLTSGSQTLTATAGGSSISCNAQVTVTAGTTLLVVSVPANANAGTALQATVTAQDAFGNRIGAYAGTVNFTSSDAAATLPPALVFNGSQNGTATVPVTFGTVGSQSFTATEAGGSGATGAGVTQVHGLVYTDPAAGLGGVRLVLNSASSNATSVQLDLVTARVVRFVYGAGLNLPVSTTRVVAGGTPLVEGNALNTGAAPKAVAAALPTSGPGSGLFVSALSQKFSGAGAVQAEATVAAGRVLYSIRMALAPGAPTGTVFDGSALPAGFRAAVRSLMGNDVVAQGEFALGKLEVR
jgi:hypothetical protein